MDKYLEQLKEEYLEIPIPPEYDAMVERTLKRKNKKPHFQQWTIGLVLCHCSICHDCECQSTGGKSDFGNTCHWRAGESRDIHRI